LQPLNIQDIRADLDMEHELCKYTRDEVTTHMIGNKSELGMNSMEWPNQLAQDEVLTTTGKLCGDGK
jgi:hypothetical protein